MQNHMRNLYHHSQIVQHYPPIFEEDRVLAMISLAPSRIFFQDQMFDELEKTTIVEDYYPGCDNPHEADNRMDEERAHIEQQPYEDLTINPYSFSPKKILDSASSGRELPARNSSISSLSSCQNIKHLSPFPAHIQSLKLEEHEYSPLKRISKARKEIGSSAQKRERLNKIKKIQQVGCNCKKSKCLKMYCQCFNLQILCSGNCNCIGCGNMNENQTHQKAVVEALTRNPRAFAEDIQKISTVFNLGVELSEVRRGCKCRKTKCLKKYCECFNSGQQCGIFCQCDGCFNCDHTNKN